MSGMESGEVVTNVRRSRWRVGAPRAGFADPRFVRAGLYLFSCPPQNGQARAPEMVVGWYHSHPGFGCSLSRVYTNTQQALIHVLNRHYYSIVMNYMKNELKEKMLLNLHKKKWTDGLTQAIWYPF